MKHIRIVFLIFALIVICANVSDAKWWIFGQSAEEITINYLYLNGLSYEEGGQKVMIYREFLQDGLVYLKGKASSGQGRIGAVQISIDGKEKWEKARLADDGTFFYSFAPEISKTYIIFLKIIDTAGKTNDVDNTRKEITVSDRNIQALIKELLDNLIVAYMNEDAAGFMTYISDDFEGDYSALDRAVRKDFNLFDGIDIRYTLNGVASDARGISVSINFNRNVMSSRSGKFFSDRGAASFVLAFGDKGLKVLSMKTPLIFGLSDSENVGTGTVAGGGLFIVIDPKTGDITTQSDGTGGASGSSTPEGFQPPKNLTIQPSPVSIKRHQVGLQWESSEGAAEYIVYEGKNLSGPWTEVETVSATSIKFTTDPVAQEATLLYYQVKAVDDDGKLSSASNVVVWDNR